MAPVTFVSQLETTQRTLIVKKSKDAGITFFSARALVGRTRNLTNKSLWFRGVASLDLDLKAQAESWARSK